MKTTLEIPDAIFRRAKSRLKRTLRGSTRRCGVILDTNAPSGAADGDPGALEIVAAAERIAVPGIVFGEYRLGTLGRGIGTNTRNGFGNGLPP